MNDSVEPRETGSGTRGRSGVAYDPDRVWESGQRGVPTGDQYPTNESDEKKNIAADVHIPGPYPSDQADPGVEYPDEPAPTKETRDADSLGDLVRGTSPSPLPEETGSPVSQVADEREPQTPQEKIDKARAESFPGGVPEDADVGTGRRKGQGLPPGSVGRGHDTPQTPAT